MEADWLIIFDNANDPYLLTDYWPKGSGSVLVTSRDPIAKSLFCTQCSGLDLTPLSDGDGAYLLETLTELKMKNQMMWLDRSHITLVACRWLSCKWPA